MKKISLYIFLIFIIHISIYSVYCEESKPKIEEKNLKIGTVNIEILLKNSLAYKAADLEWSRELAKKQDEIDQKRKELEALMKQLDTIQGDALKNHKQIESNIEQLKIDLKYLVNDNKKKLNKKEKEFYDVISKDIIHVIEEYGKTNGYDYIVNESSILVLFSDIDLDITAEMLSKYNNYWESKKNQAQPTKK
ncbi:OmpH family outer membrane protein [bacterium]|nr:OmpH family outer membrane protein [bacterium]